MMERFLVEAGSRWLEKNPARSQTYGQDMYDTTGDVRFATVFATEEQATTAAAEFQEHYPDWPVRVRSDWRVSASTLATCVRCGGPCHETHGTSVLCGACYEQAMRTQQQKSMDAARQKTRGAA